MSLVRVAVTALSLSAAGLVSIAVYEGYEPVAKPPIAGDKPTKGFGATHNPDGTTVKAGEKTTPTRALVDLLTLTNKYEKGVASCITVPVTQYEFDAYVSFAYNMGVQRFCDARFVAELNKGNYAEACDGLAFHPDGRPAWSYFNGKYYQGLHNRRLDERARCLGEKE